MLISEVIEMLKQEKDRHGDISVFVDTECGQREVEKDDDALCPSPHHEAAAAHLPERLVI